MKKYLLILSGNFSSNETCKEIALTLTPIVDSPHLKFNLSEGMLVFHFASEVSQEEIHDYIVGSLFDLVNMFILTEYNDKVSLFLPKEVETHLLDLENESENTEIKIDLDKSQSILGESEKDDDFVALLLDEVKKRVKKPSLDYLLEKIAEKGVSSLSPFEKDTLDYYSKNQ